MAYNLINRDPMAKVGMRIRMIEMGDDDDANPVDEGLEGTIHLIDDIGTLHVKWDDGRYIGVIPNLDVYQLLPSEEEQIGLDVFEAEDKPVLSGSKATPAGKNFTKKFKSPLKKFGVKAESEEDIDETMTAGGGGGLAGAAGYSYNAPLGYTKKEKKTNENKVIKVGDLLKETTNTSSLVNTVDFVVNNLLGWGTKEDMSPPWPSPTKKAENGELEDWWWQKIPTYNGGVITDPYAKTNDVWNDDKLDSNINNDMTQFQKDVYKNPKKYKQSVISTNKGFDLNIDPPNKEWQQSLQSGIIINVEKSGDAVQTFRNRHYSRTVKKEEISNFVDDLLSEEKKKESKKDTVHTVKWDRCVKAVEKKNKENGTNYTPEAVCTSSIGYEGSIKKKHRRKEDIEETTTFSSVFGGGFPVGPAFAAKKGKHGPSKKPIWKGGKIVQKIESDGVLNENKEKSNLFTEINKVKWVKGGKYVKIKDRCAKYNNQPWCSQGAIDNPLELSDNTFENIKNISNKTGLSEKYILDRIVGIMNEDTRYKLSLIDKLKIKMAGIDDDQVIYNLNNNLPIDWKGTKEGYYEKIEPKKSGTGSN